eukprot:TRINITY_DN6568_c0_g4_i1.p1 TRINITY_DN6568_c0_g4~~TRINITY_DN6568_c0_g4_i1.p1  ORF type:complete len:414 (+),score=22.31 TRINITY_DN6568_c0_g4_i1:3-1244(+)
MDNYDRISRVDVLQTNMHTNDTHILPKTLSPSEKYQLLSPSDNFQCPVLTNLKVDQSTIDIHPNYYDYYNCHCLSGMFGLRNKCLECPSSCICESGLKLEGCFPSPSLEKISVILPCLNPSACETHIPNALVLERQPLESFELCLEGYEGRGCTRCSQGYGIQGRSCVKCTSTMVQASYIIGPLIVLCFIIYLFKSKPNGSGKLGILIFHTQTLSVIFIAMSSNAGIEKSISLPNSISSIQIPAISCVLGTTDAISPLMASYIRLPILAVIGSLLYLATKSLYRDKVVYVLLNLARCIYYPIALETFGVFSCTLYDEGYDSWFLNAWPWLSCNPMSDEYGGMLAMTIPTFIVFVCGFPVLTWWIIKNNTIHSKQTSSEAERLSSRARYGFLYDYFNSSGIHIASALCASVSLR